MDIALTTGGALAAASAMALLLGALSRPPQLDARLARAEASVATAQRHLRARAATALPMGAVCVAEPTGAAESWRGAVTQTLTSAGLKVEVADVVPGAPEGALAPMRLRVRATGAYEAALAGVAGLSGLRPLLVVDSLDLISNTSSVTLSISGRAYCSAPV